MFNLARCGIILTFAFCLDVRGQLPEPARGMTQSVEVVASVPDETIRNRIVGVFAQVEELQKLEVRVQSGVVTLSGEIASARTRDEALALVRRTEGVVMVVDRLTETAAVAAKLSPAIAKLRELGKTATAKLPLIAISVVIVVLFWMLANFLHSRRGWLRRSRISSLGQTLVRRLIRIAVIGIGLVVALEVLDATAIVGTVLGAAGLAGLAIGFAFKNILENYLSGILLSTRNPFEIGDVIEINSRIGKVALLTARDTVLVTMDGNHLRIPNSIVINSELINFTRNPRRRFDFSVGVSVNLDLSDARRIGLEALAGNSGVLTDPKPIALVDNLGDSTVSLKFIAWMDQTRHDFLKTRSESIRMVKEAFDAAGVEMPEPIYRVFLRNPDAPAGGEDPGKPGKSAPAQAGAKSAPAGKAIESDLAADRTIDEQVAEEQRISDEPNLLAGAASDEF
jgi:small conductance mechanosensitive channel